GGFLPGHREEAGHPCARRPRPAAPGLRVQFVWRVERLDCARPRAAARCRRRHDRGEPHHLSRQGQGGADPGRGDQEVPGSRCARMGRTHAQLRVGDQRGLRPQAHRMDNRLRRLGRRPRQRSQADVRSGGEPQACAGSRRRRRRPGDDRQLSRIGVGLRTSFAGVRARAMTEDQKIVAVGAASGVATMIVAMTVSYRFWRVDPTLTDGASRLAYALKADVVAVVPLLLAIIAVGNKRFLSEAIDPTLQKEDRAAQIDGRVVDNTLQQYVLFLIGTLALSVNLAAEQMRVIPAAVIVFVVARVAFWIGYRIHPLYLAFG